MKTLDTYKSTVSRMVYINSNEETGVVNRKVLNKLEEIADEATETLDYEDQQILAEHIIDEIGSDEDISSDPKFSMILDMLGYE